jgi:hypothetical protein
VAYVRVVVERERLGGAQGDPAEIVRSQFARPALAVVVMCAVLFLSWRAAHDAR